LSATGRSTTLIGNRAAPNQTGTNLHNRCDGDQTTRLECNPCARSVPCPGHGDRATVANADRASTAIVGLQGFHQTQFRRTGRLPARLADDVIPPPTPAATGPRPGSLIASPAA